MQHLGAFSLQIDNSHNWDPFPMQKALTKAVGFSSKMQRFFFRNKHHTRKSMTIRKPTDALIYKAEALLVPSIAGLLCLRIGGRNRHRNYVRVACSTPLSSRGDRQP